MAASPVLRCPWRGYSTLSRLMLLLDRWEVRGQCDELFSFYWLSSSNLSYFNSPLKAVRRGLLVHQAHLKSQWGDWNSILIFSIIYRLLILVASFWLSWLWGFFLFSKLVCLFLLQNNRQMAVMILLGQSTLGWSPQVSNVVITL